MKLNLREHGQLLKAGRAARVHLNEAAGEGRSDLLRLEGRGGGDWWEER